MKNKKITRKITQGMYVLTTSGGGCIVDAVAQVSAGDNPLISVAVMKSNYTNELLRENEKFSLSVIGMETSPEIIKIFGMNSMRDIDKFNDVLYEEVQGVRVIKDSLGYMICEKEEMIDNETHTVFIGKLVEADVYSDSEPMSYGYYQEHKEELIKTVTDEGETVWVCSVCGYVYHGNVIPDDYKCPMCGVDKSYFEKK